MMTGEIRILKTRIVPETPPEIKTRLAQLAVYSDKYTLQELTDRLIQLAADVTLLIPPDENATLG